MFQAADGIHSKLHAQGLYKVRLHTLGCIPSQAAHVGVFTKSSCTHWALYQVDVSERKQAEASLSRQEDHQVMMLQKRPIGFLVFSFLLLAEAAAFMKPHLCSRKCGHLQPRVSNIRTSNFENFEIVLPLQDAITNPT